MLYSLAVALLKKRSNHYDAEMAVLTIILILGVIEAVTAVTVMGISCSSDPPPQVKRNVFINKSTFKEHYFKRMYIFIHKYICIMNFLPK